MGVGPRSRMGRRDVGALYLKDAYALATAKAELCLVVAVAIALEVLPPG